MFIQVFKRHLDYTKQFSCFKFLINLELGVQPRLPCQEREVLADEIGLDPEKMLDYIMKNMKPGQSYYLIDVEFWNDYSRYIKTGGICDFKS